MNDNKQINIPTNHEELKRKALVQVLIPDYKKEFQKEPIVFERKNTMVHLPKEKFVYCSVCGIEFFDEARTEHILRLTCKSCKATFYIDIANIIKLNEV